MAPGPSGKPVLVVPDVNVLINIHRALTPETTMQAFASKAIAANAEARRLRTSDLLLSTLGDQFQASAWFDPFTKGP